MSENLDTFEMKLEKINAILEQLNDKNLTLQNSVELYKNGVNLLKEAKQILENAELEIKEFGGENE